MQLGDLIPDILTRERALRALPITAVTADSRQVIPGALFAALPGVKVNGSSFIVDAVARGAGAILTGADEPVPEGLSIPVLRDPDPQRRFALAISRFYAPQPRTIVAVTGTNGKTSVASFTRQIWQAHGIKAAAIGTVGIMVGDETRPGNLTTPDPETLHRTLAGLQKEGIEHVALEASSHGLVQRRLDGVRFAAAAFTNLSRDHLDYHGSMEAYRTAKMRLFNTLLAPGSPAVINLDDKEGETFATTARMAGLTLLTVGEKGAALRILGIEREGLAQKVMVDHGAGAYTIRIPLIGAFQVSNALIAAMLAHAGSGLDLKDALKALETVKGAHGRLEHVATTPSGAPILVDYAHTPAALEVALQALRPFTRGRLIVAFGAGGDRDPGKRVEMGAAAERLADLAIVTDDNPRSEKPESIRAAILEGTPSALEIGDRETAIRHGISLLAPGDIFLVAGKGHERGQIIGKETLPFSDHEVIRRSVPQGTPEDASLWTAAELEALLGKDTRGDGLHPANGISIDSRTLEAGDLFFAIKGERLDGHDFVQDALAKGASAAVVEKTALGRLKNADGKLIAVENVLDALEKVAAAARARSSAKIIAVTGSVGKTSTKEALRAAFGVSGFVHASQASFNNHWGVPLTLARLPRHAAFGVFEIGMNHEGEITPLTRLVRPHAAIITTVAAVHLENFENVEGIARAKAEIFAGLEPQGIAIINRDNEWFDFLAKAAGRCKAKVVSFGSHEKADARLIKWALHEECSTVTADILGETILYKIGAPGRHVIDNSLAVLAAVKSLDGDLVRASLALQRLEQPKGRGKRYRLKVPAGGALLIDESYNANPTSVRAAIALLGQARTGAIGRRLAVLGDMLELGAESQEMHAGLLAPLQEAKIDRVYCAGPMMRALWQALPRGMRGAYAETSAGLEPILLSEIRGGDAIMVKGSFGSRMGPLVEAVIRRFGIEDQ